jgi:hypothetical protein
LVEALCYKQEGPGSNFWRCHWNFFYAQYGPGVYSASSRNEYQKIFLEEKCGRRVGPTTLPQTVSRLSIQCGIPNIWQPYWPPRPVTGIAFLCFSLL